MITDISSHVMGELILFSFQGFYFPAVIEEIQEAISSLGGRVVPKLNWSTPRVCHVTFM